MHTLPLQGSVSHQRTKPTNIQISFQIPTHLPNQPPLNHNMSRSYNEIESDIQRALLHHEVDPKLKFTKLAKLYNVPYHRLVGRKNGRADRLNLGGRNKLLSDDQELALYRIIDRCEHDGIHCRLFIIASITNFILRSAHADPESPPPTVGHN